MTTENTATGAAVVCDHPGCLARVDVATDPEHPHEVDADAGDAAAAAGWALRSRDWCPAHLPSPPPVAPLTREEAEQLLRAVDAAACIGADAESPPPRPAGITGRAEGKPEVCVWWGSTFGVGPTLGIALRKLVDARRHEVEAHAASLAREADHLRAAARRAPVLDARADAIRAALAGLDAPALPGVR